jgi:hypothetical protein
MAEDEEGIDRKHGLQLVKGQSETLPRQRGRRLDVEEYQRALRPTKSSRRLRSWNAGSAGWLRGWHGGELVEKDVGEGGVLTGSGRYVGEASGTDPLRGRY